MGARQSRRSVDITTTPKKEGIPAEGGVVGDAAAPGDGKLERIEETDTKPTTNGIAPHTDVAEDKDKDKDDATEKEKDKEKSEEAKPEETKQESAGESAAETAEATTPTEANPASPNAVTSPENKETKKKDKMKKKWSFRSISFSKKDKSKPAREEAPKNGDVTKEEPLAEGGEEAENGSATAGSPVEEKSAVSSPTAENEASPTAAAAATTASSPSAETKEESSASPDSSPADEKQEEPTPSAPTPVPVEEKKEEVEKVEAEKKVVEVSPAGGQFVPGPVEVSVFQVQTVATPSIIERKTSEDIPSQPPSSPPPTPIDASPLQQAQQAAATATAIAEAFNLPAEVAVGHSLIQPTSSSSSSASSCPERNDPSTPPTAAESLDATNPPQRPPASSADVNPTTESFNILPPKVETTLPVVNSDSSKPESTVEENMEKPAAAKSDNPSDDDDDDDACSRKKFQTVEQSPKSEIVGGANDAPLVENEASEVVVGEPKKVEPAMSEKEKALENLNVTEQAEELVKQVIEQPEIVREEEAKDVKPPAEEMDTVLESEEGPVPLSEEVVVEAKPAVVIPEDEDVTMERIDDEPAGDTDAEDSTKATESVEIIVEEKLEPEAEPDIVVTAEEIVVLEEPEDSVVPEESRPKIVVIEKEEEIEVIEISEEVTEEEESMPPPLPDSPVPTISSPRENVHSENANTVPSCVVDDTKAQLLDVENSEQVDGSPLSLPNDSSSSPSSCPANENDAYPANESQTSHFSLSSLERVPSPSDDLLPPPPPPPATEDSSNYPLPSEQLSCPVLLNVSEMKSELPVPDENDAPSPRHPTETLLTPPRSPSPQSNVSIASGLTTSTKDSSQTQLHDDQSNREFKMESVSISLNSYNESDIELKERLAESLADTVNQEESSISCQLSNNATSSTTVQETHQSTKETEAPVENNVAHDSTTASSDETSKITSPAVPSEPVVPASPPSAPAITEDVASVAKAIEEIDISDKAVAAATIECNTNEIIADARYQNNMNE
nr:A-kinase anchor protein 200-like [Osmia lignaria]